jgi:hypothetical protein
MDKAQYADNLARQRMKERKRGKRGAILLPEVCDHIVSKLVDKMSPEAISASIGFSECDFCAPVEPLYLREPN